MYGKNYLCIAFLLGTQIVAAEESTDSTADTKPDNAQTEDATEENAWKGEGELGITHTSGNTETQNFIAKLNIKRTQAAWEHQAELEVLRSEDRSEVTAERYEIDLQSNYKLSAQNYLFGTFRYEDDRFSGYDHQVSLTAGYGRKVIDTERTTLKLEGGVGMRQTKTSEETNEEGIVRLALNYSQHIGEHSVFTQDFLVEAGGDNTYTESSTGFKVSVMDNVALKLSFTAKRNSDVPTTGTEEIDKNDTISAVTLVYSF